MTALAQELVVVRERKMHFTKCALLMQDLLAAKRDLRLSREIKRLGRYDGLIIDDLGYLQQSRDDMEVVFTLLAERYERGSVLMTSNLPFSKWEAIFKDAMMTAAAIDRLVHHSVIIELNIPSYRVEEAKKNNRQKARRKANESGGRRSENRTRERAVEMPGLWKAWKAKSRLPTLPTSPLEISPKAARFPHSHSSGGEADGKVENQKQVSHFPTAPTSFSLKNPKRGARASPSAGGGAPRRLRSRVIVVDREK